MRSQKQQNQYGGPHDHNYMSPNPGLDGLINYDDDPDDDSGSDQGLNYIHRNGVLSTANITGARRKVNVVKRQRVATAGGNGKRANRVSTANHRDMRNRHLISDDDAWHEQRGMRNGTNKTLNGQMKKTESKLDLL